ncbi:hypothetical protein J5N97_027212 [Dioscorea zingiberensis]|uniref:Uncharacterized protein n=1 Tax=Dioscorea zingiberensis TaxID=325984 RepID=A0A9D5C4U6_9LILI|nr:hypothetical protein J5N97_027212 [Dioscorea zingiberensis]
MAIPGVHTPEEISIWMQRTCAQGLCTRCYCCGSSGTGSWHCYYSRWLPLCLLNGETKKIIGKHENGCTRLDSVMAHLSGRTCDVDHCSNC